MTEIWRRALPAAPIHPNTPLSTSRTKSHVCIMSIQRETVKAEHCRTPGTRHMVHNSKT